MQLATMQAKMKYSKYYDETIFPLITLTGFEGKNKKKDFFSPNFKDDIEEYQRDSLLLFSAIISIDY